MSYHSNKHSLAVSMEGVMNFVESVSLQCYNALEQLRCTWCFCRVETKAFL